jgi:hypothetical protein
MTQKGLLKSQLQDILNRKLDEREIKDILNREKIARSPLGRSGSMTRLFEVTEESHNPKQAPTKSRIIGLQSVAGSNIVDSSRGSINKSLVSMTSENKTGKSIERVLGRDVSPSRFAPKSNLIAKSPVPTKDKRDSKLSPKPSIIPTTGTPQGEKRLSVKGSVGTPKGSTSARITSVTMAKKPEPTKPAIKDNKMSSTMTGNRVSTKPTTMPLVKKSEASKKTALLGSGKKPDTRGSYAAKKDFNKVPEKKQDQSDKKLIESQVKMIMTGQDMTPETARQEEKTVGPVATTSQWEVAEAPKPSLEQINDQKSEMNVEDETTNTSPLLAQASPVEEVKVEKQPERVPEEIDAEKTETIEVKMNQPVEESLINNLADDSEFIFEGKDS